MSIRFDVEEGPVVDYVSPPNALNMEGQRSVVTSAFPDSNFECEYHFMYYFTMRNVVDYNALAAGSPQLPAKASSPLHASANHPQHRPPHVGSGVDLTSPSRTESMGGGDVPLKEKESPVSTLLESRGKEKDLDSSSSASQRFHSPFSRFSNVSSPFTEACAPSPLSSSTLPSTTGDHGRWIGSPPSMRHSAWISSCTASMVEALERMKPKELKESAAATAATATRVFHNIKQLRSPRLYGCAYYRQKRDPGVPRGSVQQVFVLLSSTPYHVLHELALRVIVSRLLQCCPISPDPFPVECSSALAPYPTLFFPSDPSFHPFPGAETAVLDRAYLEMCCWPPPHPNASYKVCLLHQTLSFVTPGHTARTNLFLGERSSSGTTVPCSRSSRSTSSRKVEKGGHEGRRLPLEACGSTRLLPTSHRDAPRGGVNGVDLRGLPIEDRRDASLHAHPLELATKAVPSVRSRQFSNEEVFSPPSTGSKQLHTQSSPLFSSPRQPSHGVGTSSPPSSSLTHASEASGKETETTPQAKLTLPAPLSSLSSTYSSPSSSFFSTTALRLSSSTGIASSSSSSLRRPYHGTLSTTAGSHALSSVIPLFALLHSHLDHLTRVWELLITHQPVCILSDTSACTAGVAHAISALIAPLLFTGKLYAHATSRHEDMERLRRLGKELPFSSSESVIVACTNRMLFKSFQAWPSWVIVLDEAFLPPPSMTGEGGPMGTLLQHASSSAVRRHRQQSITSKHSSLTTGWSPPFIPVVPHRSAVLVTTEEGEAGGKAESTTAPFFPAPKRNRSSRVSSILFASLGDRSGFPFPEGGQGEGRRESRTTHSMPQGEAEEPPTTAMWRPSRSPRRTDAERESLSAARSSSESKWMTKVTSLATFEGSSLAGSSARAGVEGRRSGRASRQGWCMEMEGWECVPEYTIDSSSADSLSGTFSSLSSSPQKGTEAEKNEWGERGRETLPFVSPPMPAADGTQSPPPEKAIHRGSPSFGAARIGEQLLSSDIRGASQESTFPHDTPMERVAGSPTRDPTAFSSPTFRSRRLLSATDHDAMMVDHHPPFPIPPPSSSGEAAYYFHSGFTSQTLKKVFASQVPALLGPLSSLEASRVEHSQQCSSNYFDASYSFVLDHTTLQQSLHLQLEKISGLDATSQALTMSLQLDQLYAGWTDGQRSSPSDTDAGEKHSDPVLRHPTLDDTKGPSRDGLDETIFSSTSESTMPHRFGASVLTNDGKEMQKDFPFARHPTPPMGLKEFSSSTVFAQQSVADVTLRRFFRSLTLEFLRPVDVWFSEELHRTPSILEWCDGKRGHTVLTSAQFMQFMDQNHRRVIGTSIKGSLSYGSYQGIYEKFSKGVLFHGYLQQLMDGKIREELAQFSLQSWLQLYPSENARRSHFFALLQLILQEMEEVMDSDVEFVRLCLSVLQQMTSTPVICEYQKLLEDFAAKWGDSLGLSNEM